jgi:hypothetical protein
MRLYPELLCAGKRSDCREHPVATHTQYRLELTVVVPAVDGDKWGCVSVESDCRQKSVRHRHPNGRQLWGVTALPEVGECNGSKAIGLPLPVPTPRLAGLESAITVRVDFEAEARGFTVRHLGLLVRMCWRD